MQYTDASAYVSGWKKRLSQGERAMGASAILGGVLTQTTYQPEQASCSVFGESALYGLRYTTGTAWYKHLFVDPDLNVNNDEVIDKVPLGKTPSQTPGIHLGETREQGGVTIINMNSDRSNSVTLEQNLEGIVSKEVGWRQL